MLQDLRAPPDRSSIVGTIVARGSMNKLTSQQIDAFEEPIQHQCPVLLDVPALRFASRSPYSFRPLLGWLLPEESTQILIVEQGHHKLFVFQQQPLN